MPNCFEIHAFLYKLWSGQICTDARTHAHTPNKKCNNYVSLTRNRICCFFSKEQENFLFVCVCVGGGGEGRGGTRVSIFCYKESNPNLKKKIFFFWSRGREGGGRGGGGG